MDQKEVVLAAFAPGKAAWYTPVQAQKLIFLLERNIAPFLGGKHFSFTPYHYGPFDAAVYRALDELTAAGLVEIASVVGQRWSKFRLTTTGQQVANGILEGVPEPGKGYIRAASDFVRQASFTDLVSAIYKAYPDMKQNSVMEGV